VNYDSKTIKKKIQLVKVPTSPLDHSVSRFILGYQYDNKCGYFSEHYENVTVWKYSKIFKTFELLSSSTNFTIKQNKSDFWTENVIFEKWKDNDGKYFCKARKKSIFRHDVVELTVKLHKESESIPPERKTKRIDSSL
jgi:hypothetical protein